MKIKLEFQSHVGSIVRDIRKKKNITQKDLADYCNLSARAIIKIEKGKSDIKLSTLLKLSELLGFDLCLHDRKVTKE